MTTNNLIGYDPLAWMDGETLEEIPPAPAKKVTKSKAKVTPVIDEIEKPVLQKNDEIVEVVTVKETELADSPVVMLADDAVEPETEELEIDVTIDENGEIDITIDTTESIQVEIAVEKPQMDNDIIDEIVEEVREISVEEAKIEILESPVEKIIEPLIELNADATIKNIAKLYDTIKRALAVHDTIEINASDVTAVDTATLQLLVSLKKDVPESHKIVNIIYPSARFIESAKLLNLLDVLEVTEV
ncbi:MAG: STAS domain-containing protein [Methylococcales bacterium]|nr:STAS domain-containing protein [Methylococcales bacterium]MDD5754077.1 STAS domain-containing protein [Methylococcales bacterium]